MIVELSMDQAQFIAGVFIEPGKNNLKKEHVIAIKENKYGALLFERGELKKNNAKKNKG